MKHNVKSCAINKISQLGLFTVIVKFNLFFKNNTISVGWNLNDSITSLLPNISFLSRAKWLHSTKRWWTVRIHWQSSHWGGGSFLKIYEWGQMCMTDAGTTQNNFTLPAPPVGGLPISQDWLDRMKLVRNRTVPIILPSGKNILAATTFKISVGYTNLGMRQIQCRLGSRVCPFITPNSNMAGYSTKYNVFFGKIKKDTLSYHHPNPAA